MSSSIKKVVKPVDDYLRFIEEHFNVGNDNNYSDIVRQLNSMASQLRMMGAAYNPMNITWNSRESKGVSKAIK